MFSRIQDGRTVVAAFNPSAKSVKVRIKLSGKTSAVVKLEAGEGCGLSFSGGYLCLQMKGVSYGLFRTGMIFGADSQPISYKKSV